MSNKLVKKSKNYNLNSANYGIETLDDDIFKKGGTYMLSSEDGFYHNRYFDKRTNTYKTLPLPEVTIRPDNSSDTNSKDKIRDAYTNVILNLRNSGYNNWADEVENQNLKGGVGNALAWYQGSLARYNELQRAEQNANAVREGRAETVPWLAPLVLSPALPYLTNAATTFTKDLVGIGKPFWTNFVKDATVSTAGYVGVDEAHKHLTRSDENPEGLTFGEGIRNILPDGPKWIPEGVKQFGADALNPGGWATWGLGSKFKNILIDSGKQFIYKPIKVIQDAKSKYTTFPIRKSTLQHRIYESPAPYDFQDLDNARHAPYDVINKAIKDRSRIRSEIYDLAESQEGIEKQLDVIRRKNTPFYYDVPKRNMYKDLSSKNLNIDAIAEELGGIKYDGRWFIPKSPNFEYFPTGDTYIYDLKSGKLHQFNLTESLPTSQEMLQFPENYRKALEGISYTPTVTPSRGIKPLPEEYTQLLRKNIDYVQELFPQGKIFGSSKLAPETGLPIRPNDTELYILKEDFDKLGLTGGKDLMTDKQGRLITYNYSLGKFPDPKDPSINLGDVDFNIIYSKPDGTLDFTSDRSLNLFRQLYPDEFQKAYVAANGDLSKMYHPMPAKDVLNEVSIKNTLMDTFESSKPKHMERGIWYINYGDPDMVYDALLRSSESLVGKNMRHAPVTEQMFTDPEANKELIALMELQDHILDINEFVRNPKKMRNLFEYWWENNTVLSRGTSIESAPGGERDFSKYAKRNMLRWSGGVGYNHSGTGLNTVKYGDSGGGVRGTDVYGQIQPYFEIPENASPKQIIQTYNSNFPKYDDVIPIEGLTYKERPLKTFKDILDLKDNITPDELEHLSNQLGIRGIVGNIYGASKYVGGTTPFDKPNDLLFMTPAFGRNGKYVSPTNSDMRHLRTKMASFPSKYTHHTIEVPQYHWESDKRYERMLDYIRRRQDQLKQELKEIDESVPLMTEMYQDKESFIRQARAEHENNKHYRYWKVSDMQRPSFLWYLREAFKKYNK